MDKNAKNIFETEIFEKPSLAEECKKYGIEYNEPRFVYVLGYYGDVVIAPKYYFLESDVSKIKDFSKITHEYYMNLLEYVRCDGDEYKSFECLIAFFKLNKSIKKFKKIEKEEKIKCYSETERDEYINNYKNEKITELEKTKAISKAAKEEMIREK